RGVQPPLRLHPPRHQESRQPTVAALAQRRAPRRQSRVPCRHGGDPAVFGGQDERASGAPCAPLAGTRAAARGAAASPDSRRRHRGQAARPRRPAAWRCKRVGPGRRDRARAGGRTPHPERGRCQQRNAGDGTGRRRRRRGHHLDRRQGRGHGRRLHPQSPVPALRLDQVGRIRDRRIRSAIADPRHGRADQRRQPARPGHHLHYQPAGRRARARTRTEDRMSEEQKVLLVVEDDEGLQRQLKWAYDGYEVVCASDRPSAIDALRAHEPAVVTLDLGLPPDPDGTEEGFATLAEILRLKPDTKVIVATGHGARESATRAIAMGAYDFYKKPVDIDELGLIVARAFHLHEIEDENRRLETGAAGTVLGSIITAAPEMLKVARTIERVSTADVSVILLEAELFGYERGAFTGAVKSNVGKIELAQGGTLFLDEVGDIPLPLQVKLLRFLQERVIERIGGRQTITVDTRIVCATHQDL